MPIILFLARSNVEDYAHRRTYQFMRRAKRNQFMRRLNQIEMFVRSKADRCLKCLQYDPYIYHVVYQ